MYPADIRPLTSLRIAAALWVLVYHFRLHLDLHLDRFGLIAKGYLGVDLFFILSGFILSHVYLSQAEAKRFNYGSFLWARLARIYPVHIVTLLATVVLWLIAIKIGAKFEPVAFDPAVLPQHLLLIHAWGTTPTVQWNFPSWSISAEWFAYLLFPATAFVVLRISGLRSASVVIALALFFLMFWSVERLGLPLSEVTRLGFIRIVPAFLFGAALYRFGRDLKLANWAGWTGAFIALLWIVVAASLRASDAVIWPALGLLIFSLAEISKHNPTGVLGSATLVYLGEISYSVYMTHLPIDIAYFHALGRIAPNMGGAAAWAGWIGVFLVILVASVASYHLVEQPARNRMRGHDPFRRRPLPEPRNEPVI